MLEPKQNGCLLHSEAVAKEGELSYTLQNIISGNHRGCPTWSRVKHIFPIPKSMQVLTRPLVCHVGRPGGTLQRADGAEHPVTGKPTK